MLWHYFDKVSLQIVELAGQLAKQAEVIKELQAKAAKTAATAPSHPPAIQPVCRPRK